MRKALIRHARAVDAILEVKAQGLAPSDEQRSELGGARRAFEEVRPFGWQDAEAACSKDNSLACEASAGALSTRKPSYAWNATSLLGAPTAAPAEAQSGR